MKNDVYIVGGGTSLKGFNFAKLRDKDTIAINVAALDVPNPTYSITADSSIFQKVQEGYFKNVKTNWVLVTNPNHTCMKRQTNGSFINTKSGYIYNLFCMDIVIKNKDCGGIGFSFNDFKTGYNSGFCGFQLAVLLGYKNIHLLGFDMAGTATSHYHKRYGKRRISAHSFNTYFNNFVLALKILEDRNEGFSIISHSVCSPLNLHIPYEPLGNI